MEFPDTDRIDSIILTWISQIPLRSLCPKRRKLETVSFSPFLTWLVVTWHSKTGKSTAYDIFDIFRYYLNVSESRKAEISCVNEKSVSRLWKCDG